jgi:hypothetical protein
MAICSLPIYEEDNFQWQVAKNLDPLYKHKPLCEKQNTFLEEETRIKNKLKLNSVQIVKADKES